MQHEPPNLAAILLAHALKLGPPPAILFMFTSFVGNLIIGGATPVKSSLAAGFGSWILFTLVALVIGWKRYRERVSEFQGEHSD